MMQRHAGPVDPASIELDSTVWIEYPMPPVAGAGETSGRDAAIRRLVY